MDRVLVTGITGFIGLHCAREALRQGYAVRGTLRSPERVETIKRVLERSLIREVGETEAEARVEENLEFAVTDLLAEEGWHEAMRGCRYVLHVASPAPSQHIEDPDALVRPAREGSLRVLRYAARTPDTERVVMTSSTAAVVQGHERDADTVYDETTWSIPERCAAYPRSKTLAERAAWDYVEDLRLELVTLCPGMVYGPVLHPDSCSGSGEPVRKLMAREIPGIPALGWAPVDVRDIADLHVRAMTTPAAAGERFLLGLEHMSLAEVAKVLAGHFGPKGWKIPQRHIPGWGVRLLAIFDGQVRHAAQDLDRYERVSNAKARRILDWEPRDPEAAVIAMAESMVELGIVSKG